MNSMEIPLIVAGVEIFREPFAGSSPFYPDYSYHIANASPLNVASAIGAVRQAERPTLAHRMEYLHRAAEAFTYTAQDVEHSVRLTGMPVTLVKDLFAEIPDILRTVPTQSSARFQRTGGEEPQEIENIAPGLYKALLPHQGFCYAITPGNDPRPAAIVAANLGYLGIPFILRASIRDAAAPLVIRALIAGGFDPCFCNLVYLDRADPMAVSNHTRMAAACSIVWTFGPPKSIDRTLRYRTTGRRVLLDFSRYIGDPSDLQALAAFVDARGPNEIAGMLRFEDTREDLFAGKTVLRHAAGNCASVTYGPLTAAMEKALYASIGYAIVCTATKSVMVVEGKDWIPRAAEFLASLVVGDPLDPLTQVGYVDARCLDWLAELRKKNSLRATFYGGERLSPQQATPLLVASQEELPDFFAQEIPAYVLAVSEVENLPEAIQRINHYTGTEPRLAVSTFNFPKETLSRAMLEARAHTVLVNKPTSTLLPAFHEGNDYALLLRQALMIGF